MLYLCFKEVMTWGLNWPSREMQLRITENPSGLAVLPSRIPPPPDGTAILPEYIQCIVFNCCHRELHGKIYTPC
jgi:hypothetical protein